MNEIYMRGFITKCAEYGIDPEQLIKVALNLGHLGRMSFESIKKLAPGLADDTIKSFLGGKMGGRESQQFLSAVRKGMQAMPAAGGTAAQVAAKYVPATAIPQTAGAARHFAPTAAELGSTAASGGAGVLSRFWKALGNYPRATAGAAGLGAGLGVGSMLGGGGGAPAVPEAESIADLPQYASYAGRA